MALEEVEKVENRQERWSGRWIDYSRQYILEHARGKRGDIKRARIARHYIRKVACAA